ncbi:MAG TPA: polysaccharide biosynthesis C-terminal domain-containing protein [Myxococcales bacterium]|nr:polysaccharide biosynthesis C-terminal domain-containing protein [Myxococcales bacterium]
MLARATSAVIGVLTPLYLARALALEEYGTYKQLFLLCGPLFSVLPLGMVQSLYFFVPRSVRGPRAVLLQTQLFTLGIGGVGAVLLWFGLPVAAARFENPALLQFRGLLTLFVLFSLASGLLETSLTSQGRTRSSALAYMGYEVLKSLALVAPVLLGFGLKGSVAVLAALTLARLGVVLAVVLRAKGDRPSWAGLRAQVAYALPFGAAMLLDGPQQAAHQYAVALAVPTALYAIYAAGCFQVPLVNLLYAPTSEVLMVRVGQLDGQGLGGQAVRLFREATRKLALVFIPASAFLVISAPWVVRALFGEKFGGAVPIFRVSVLGIMLACMPLDGLLRARGMTRQIFHSYLAKAAVTLPLLAVLVPWLGMLGGILSWLAAEVVGKAMLLWRLPRALAAGGPPPALRDFLPVRDLGMLGGATAACAAAALALASWMGAASLALGGRGGAVLQVAFEGALFAGMLFPVLRVIGLRPMALLASLVR